MKTSRPANAIRRFLELQASGGILLLAAAGVALLFANTPGLAGWYQYFLDVPIEIKRAALEEELASSSRLALPTLAALMSVTGET